MNDTCVLDYQPFDPRRVDEYDEAMIDFAVNRAELYNQELLNNLQRIDHNCTTMLGWMIAAISALTGFAVMALVSADTNWRVITLAIVAIILLTTASVLLMYANFFKRGVALTGCDPDLFFNDEVCFWAKSYYPDSSQKMIKACYLQTLQNRIIHNVAEIEHRVMYYRGSLIIVLCAVPVLIGMFVLLVL